MKGIWSIIQSPFLFQRKEYSFALAEQMEVLLPASTVNGFDPKVEREIGRILGYREKDIEYYIQHFQDNLEKYRQQYS